ncbi:MAG TPA: DNA repair protein RecN [Desulfuromonadales bacterium]|nr:DNA repair protein RecN [Desulfuromonadales bacterium]
MLTELIIRNLAIINRLHVTFGSGFNVLTGETGAGKSIIIDAVGLLLGDRARPELIRTGEDEATVEALFDLSARPVLRHELLEAGFEGEDDQLVVKRVVSRSGKNRVYLNGSLAKLGQLQSFTAQLLTIYGQHEHQSLQRTETHLALLDHFAGLDEDVDAYRYFFNEVSDLDERLRQIDEAERERQQRLDYLSFQSREIAAAGLVAGEDEQLSAEKLLLQNAERLSAATGGGYDVLYGDEDAVCGRLATAAANLEALSDVDPTLGPIAETLRNSQYALEDAAVQLRVAGEKNTFEPGRQDVVEERLALIASLKRKYAPTIEDILARQDEIDRELAELSDVAATRESLQKKATGARERLQAAGEAISTRRLEAAQELAAAMERELKDLAMEKARFEIQFFPLNQPGPRGLERGEFYLAPNPGEEPRPLAWIASGGELSRVMLALKRAAPDGDRVPTLIFDEVDAGIGGVAATAVGEKLHAAAQGLQVLCITHLPQVAAFADKHFRVEKHEEAGRTFTALMALEEDERVLEMARMLGGAQVTDRTLEHARELIGASLRPE